MKGTPTSVGTGSMRSCDKETSPLCPSLHVMVMLEEQTNDRGTSDRGGYFQHGGLYEENGIQRL